MRYILGATLGAMLLIAAPSHAAAQESDPVELAEARAIVAIMFPPEHRRETFAAAMAEITGQLRAAMPPSLVEDPGLKAIIDTFVNGLSERMMPTVEKHLPHILDATAVAYAREFSLDELKEIHTFARTPAGGHYLTASLSLIGDPAVAAANTRYFTDLQALQNQAQRELIEQISAYLKDNPELAESLGRSS